MRVRGAEDHALLEFHADTVQCMQEIFPKQDGLYYTEDNEALTKNTYCPLTPYSASPHCHPFYSLPISVFHATAVTVRQCYSGSSAHIASLKLHLPRKVKVK